MSLISSKQGLTQLPANLPWREFDYAMVESPAALDFLGPAAVHQGAASFYLRGVAFGEESELRWLLRDSGYHVVYISDAGTALQGADRKRGLESAPAGQPDQLLLWGELEANSNDLFTGRIPRALHYPGPIPAGARRAAIQLRHYYLGEAPLYRFVRVAWQ